MAKAADRAGTRTVLAIGQVKIPVGLFSTKVDKPAKLAEFDTAGPNGGVLKAEARARAVPVGEVREFDDTPVHSDPFADDDASAGIGAVPVDLPPALRPPTPGESLLGDPDVVQASVEAGATVEGMTEIVGDALGREDKSVPAPALLDALGLPSEHEKRGELAERLERELGPMASVGERDTFMDELRGLAQRAERVDGEYGRVLVEAGTDQVVEPQNVRRGVRLPDGSFIDCTEQLAKIEERTKLEAMTVIGFVDVTRVPRAWVIGAKYVGADSEDAPHALRIIFEGLKRTRRGAVVKLTKRSRQSLGVIAASQGVLVLYELVWREDFREAPARARVIQQAEVFEREVAVFEGLVHAMSLPAGGLDGLRDDAIALREQLKADALAGELPSAAPGDVPRHPEESRLLAQLEASLAAVGS